MIYGFSPLSGGTIRVFGLDIGPAFRRIRARIGVCQQGNTLDPDLSVLENLLVFAGYFRIPAAEARARAEELLSFFALEGRKRFKYEELSGGMPKVSPIGSEGPTTGPGGGWAAGLLTLSGTATPLWVDTR